MSGEELGQLFSGDAVLLESAFNPMQIALSLSATFLMAILIYFIYKKTYNGVLYSKNFNLTLIMTALTVDAIMMGISGNLILSLGMVGALSIVRFRTAVKDPRDTAFLFWAITVGVINGVAYYELSLMASLFMAFVLIFMSGGAAFEPSYMLILKYKDGNYEKMESLLNKYLSHYFIRSDSVKDGVVEKVIEIKIKQNMREAMLKDVRGLSYIDSCVLLSSNGEFSE